MNSFEFVIILSSFSLVVDLQPDPLFPNTIGPEQSLEKSGHSQASTLIVSVCHLTAFGQLFLSARSQGETSNKLPTEDLRDLRNLGVIKVAGAIKCRQNKKEHMNITKLILVIGAVALTAATFNANATEPLLSPRANGNQIKFATNNTPDSAFAKVYYVKSNNALLSPRAQGNQIKVLAGTNGDVNPALACAKSMTASPRAITECSSHTTMPGCQQPSVAVLK